MTSRLLPATAGGNSLSASQWPSLQIPLCILATRHLTWEAKAVYTYVCWVARMNRYACQVDHDHAKRALPISGNAFDRACLTLVELGLLNSNRENLDADGTLMLGIPETAPDWLVEEMTQLEIQTESHLAIVGTHVSFDRRGRLAESPGCENIWEPGTPARGAELSK